MELIVLIHPMPKQGLTQIGKLDHLQEPGRVISNLRGWE
jgi:hypothetical protein